jgi:hypothetical protein
MPIPSEFQNLIDRLNFELDEIEHEANEGLNLLEPIMSQFPTNASFIQFFAYFQTSLFFAETARRRIGTTIEQLSSSETRAIVWEWGEDLASLLGEAIETKMRGRNLLERLRNLS